MANRKLNNETDRIPTTAEYVKTLLESAPPLTTERRAKLQTLLAPMAGGAV